jgi:hypothetical protein
MNYEAFAFQVFGRLLHVTRAIELWSTVTYHQIVLAQVGSGIYIILARLEHMVSADFGTVWHGTGQFCIFPCSLLVSVSGLTIVVFSL